MTFETRDRYRHAVEKLAKRCDDARATGRPRGDRRLRRRRRRRRAGSSDRARSANASRTSATISSVTGERRARARVALSAQRSRRRIARFCAATRRAVLLRRARRRRRSACCSRSLRAAAGLGVMGRALLTALLVLRAGERDRHRDRESAGDDLRSLPSRLSRLDYSNERCAGGDRTIVVVPLLLDSAASGARRARASRGAVSRESRSRDSLRAAQRLPRRAPPRRCRRRGDRRGGGGGRARAEPRYADCAAVLSLPSPAAVERARRRLDGMGAQARQARRVQRVSRW